MTAPATEKAAPIPAEVRKLAESTLPSWLALTWTQHRALLRFIARAIMQDRADRASQEERIREDEREAWRPMSSAPRDGTHILAVLHREGIRDMDDGWMPAFSEVREIWFKPHRELGMDFFWHAGDPYDSHDGMAPDHFGEGIPVAWMPLPDRARLRGGAS